MGISIFKDANPRLKQMDKINDSTTIVVKQIPTDISNIRQFYEYENITITNRDEFETASAYFLQTKGHLKLVESERVKITGPINQALKATNDLFKRISDPLNKIKDQLNSKMQVFADSERKKLEDQKRIELETQKKQFEEDAKKARLEAIELGSETALEVANNFEKRAKEIDTENVEVKQTVRLGAIGTMAERRTWKWKVVDFNKVHRDFLMINEKAVNHLMREILAAGGQDLKMEGIEFYQETSFSATTR